MLSGRADKQKQAPTERNTNTKLSRKVDKNLPRGSFSSDNTWNTSGKSADEMCAAEPLISLLNVTQDSQQFQLGDQIPNSNFIALGETVNLSINIQPRMYAVSPAASLTYFTLSVTKPRNEFILILTLFSFGQLLNMVIWTHILIC